LGLGHGLADAAEIAEGGEAGAAVDAQAFAV
jgi:hypothetical protein